MERYEGFQSMAPKPLAKEITERNAWVLDHLPADDLNALMARAREYRHATLVFRTAAERAQELLHCSASKTEDPCLTSPQASQ